MTSLLPFMVFAAFGALLQLTCLAIFEWTDRSKVRDLFADGWRTLAPAFVGGAVLMCGLAALTMVADTTVTMLVGVIVGYAMIFSAMWARSVVRW